MTPVPRPAPREPKPPKRISRRALDKDQRAAKRRAKASLIGSPLAHHAELMKVADDLWSVWVRAKEPGCEMCGIPLPPEGLQWAHGLSRGRTRIRYNDLNGFALCFGCHRRHTPSGPEWFDWMKRRIGEVEFRNLVFFSTVGPKLTTSALQLIVIFAQNRIATLLPGERKQWALWRAGVITKRLVSFGRIA